MPASPDRVSTWADRSSPVYPLDAATLYERTVKGFDYVEAEIAPDDCPDELLSRNVDGWAILAHDADGDRLYEGEIHSRSTAYQYTGKVVKFRCLPGEL